MLVELELLSVSKSLAQAKTADGKIVNFGYKKSVNILAGLQTMPVGTKFTADLNTSEQGRLYNAVTMDVEEAYSRFNILRKKESILDKQIAAFED